MSPLLYHATLFRMAARSKYRGARLNVNAVLLLYIGSKRLVEGDQFEIAIHRPYQDLRVVDRRTKVRLTENQQLLFFLSLGNIADNHNHMVLIGKNYPLCRN